MPKGITNFQRSWLTKVDSNGHHCLGAKNTPAHQTTCFALYAAKVYYMATQDWFKFSVMLNQRSKWKFPKLNLANHSKSHFSKPVSTYVNPTSHTDKSTEGTLQINAIYKVDNSYNEQVTAAEIQWAMKVEHRNYSYRSCDNISELFETMFPYEVSKDLSMSKGKISYVISDGLGPYFHQQPVKDITDSNAMFTLQFDETGNAQNKK